MVGNHWSVRQGGSLKRRRRVSSRCFQKFKHLKSKAFKWVCIDSVSEREEKRSVRLPRATPMNVAITSTAHHQQQISVCIDTVNTQAQTSCPSFGVRIFHRACYISCCPRRSTPSHRLLCCALDKGSHCDLHNNRPKTAETSAIRVS